MQRTFLVASTVALVLIGGIVAETHAQRRGGGWGGGGSGFSIGPGGFSYGSGNSGFSVGDGGWGGISYGRNYGYGYGPGYGYGRYNYGYPGYYGGYGYNSPQYYGYGNGYYSSGYYTQPTYVQPTYVQPSSQYAAAPYEGPGVAIHNVGNEPVRFTLDNGRSLTVNPGETQRLMDRGQFVVSFDRGAGFGQARYTIVEGHYDFTPTERGIELYRQSSDTIAHEPDRNEPADRTAERPLSDPPRILE